MLKRFIFTGLLAFLPVVGSADQINWGLEGDAWQSSSGTQYGWEAWSPVYISLHLDQGIRVYGQGSYNYANYTDPFNGSVNLNAFSDTIVGGEFTFKTFSIPSILNVGVNIPTGNSSWESQQVNAIVPVEFIDSRYRGRGFGLSTFYGIDLVQGTAEYGMAAGYLYSGAFNPSFNVNSTIDSLKLGDSFFLSFNFLRHFPREQSEVIRLSGFLFTNTQADGTDTFQMGPNFNASYAWNSHALSFELGGSAYLSAQRVVKVNNVQQFTTEPYDSFGPRIYLTPSYAFNRDLAVSAEVKYVFTNGYPNNKTYTGFYDGGGWVFQIEPSLRLWMDSGSFLKFTFTYDDVIAINGDTTNQFDEYYYYWKFGTSYEVKL